MSGSMYVSDPEVWRRFYRNMLDGKFNPEQYRPRQSGGGIGGMYKKSYMIPVNPHLDYEQEEKIVVGKQVTPMAAVVERAKSELRDKIEQGLPHVPVAQEGGAEPRIPPPPGIPLAQEGKGKKRKTMEEVGGRSKRSKCHHQWMGFCNYHQDI